MQCRQDNNLFECWEAISLIFLKNKFSRRLNYLNFTRVNSLIFFKTLDHELKEKGPGVFIDEFEPVYLLPGSSPFHDFEGLDTNFFL